MYIYADLCPQPTHAVLCVYFASLQKSGDASWQWEKARGLLKLLGGWSAFLIYC